METKHCDGGNQEQLGEMEVTTEEPSGWRDSPVKGGRLRVEVTMGQQGGRSRAPPLCRGTCLPGTIQSHPWRIQQNTHGVASPAST